MSTETERLAQLEFQLRSMASELKQVTQLKGQLYSLRMDISLFASFGSLIALAALIPLGFDYPTRVVVGMAILLVLLSGRRAALDARLASKSQ